MLINKTTEFLPYRRKADKLHDLAEDVQLHDFTENARNVDTETVDSFGNEWTKFSAFTEEDLKSPAAEYFDLLNGLAFGADSRALDVGCGTGRWSRILSDRVGTVEAIDPSKAVLAAIKYNQDKPNIRFTKAGVDDIPFEDSSFDLVICLGVLHHVPDTQAGISSIHRLLKPDGKFLVYLYYALDNRPAWYKAVFWLSSLFRRIICKLPDTLKEWVCDLISILVYWPLARFASLLNRITEQAKWVQQLPLSYYADKTFKVMRNDSLDRFGTPLEQRFSKEQIRQMLTQAGFRDIEFSPLAPYWHVIASK